MSKELDTNIRLGNNLRYYRKLRDLTLKEMAERIGMSWSTYQKYETGQIKHIDIDVVRKFSRVLDTPTSVLLGWTEELEATKKDLAHAEKELKMIESKMELTIMEKKTELKKIQNKYHTLEASIDHEQKYEDYLKQKDEEISRFFDDLMTTYEKENKDSIAFARDILLKNSNSDVSEAAEMYQQYQKAPDHIKAAVESLLKGSSN